MSFHADTRFGPIQNPAALEKQLLQRVGILECGLFVQMATDLIVAAPEGVSHVQRDSV